MNIKHVALVFFGAFLSLNHPANSAACTCSMNSTYSPAAVNIVVLPYQEFGKGSDTTMSDVEALSQIITLDLLLTTNTYQDVAVSKITESCDSTAFIDSEGKSHGKGAFVVFWGLAFHDQESLIVRNFLTFSGPNGAERIELRVGSNNLAGGLPNQGFTFLPRKLSHEQIRSMSNSVTEGLWEGASASGQASPAQKALGCWNIVAQHAGRKLGVISDGVAVGFATSINRDRGLRKLLPELDVVEGVAGYLQGRQIFGSEFTKETEIALAQSARNLSSEAEAKASIQSLRGFLEYYKSDGSLEGIERAEKLFSEAESLVPGDPAFTNLAEITAAYLAYAGRKDGFDSRRTTSSLLNAATSDPENAALQENVANIYAILKERGLPPGAVHNSTISDEESQLVLSYLSASAETEVKLASREALDSHVLARYGTRTVTAGEVRKNSATEFDQLELRFMQCRSEYERSKHDVMDAQVHKFVQDSLIEKEAAAKSMPKAALLASAVKVNDPTDADVDAFYEENKARIPLGTTREQIGPQIKNYLAQQRQNEAREKFITELEAKYGVRYTLKAMRVEVAAMGPQRGPKDAPVTIVEFSDFQCPFCSRLFSTVEQVKSTYGDKVRLVFRQFPLNFHQFAQKAAEASLCADEQGKFWEMHNAMFGNQNELAVEKLKQKAARLGLKADQFNTCLDGGKYAPKVAEDLRAGSEAGVSGTPALFVNGRFISGAVPYADIAKLIDDELQRKAAK